MPAVGHERRPAMRRVAGRFVQRGERLRRAAGGGDARQPADARARKDDEVVDAPGAAARLRIRHVADHGRPPPAEIRLSFRSAKKAIFRLSGAQNAKLAPSVPASGRAASLSSGCSQTAFRLSPAISLQTIVVPSGESSGTAYSIGGAVN